MIARKYRNRRIGEFLKESKLTEGINTGVPKIKRALENNGSKEPEFETNDTRDYFITTIFMHEGFESEIKNQPTIHQDKILEFCKETKTTKEIMSYLGLRDRRNFYLKYMRPLLYSGKLQMTIPDKPNTKNQKYVTK